jgi:hypothetical protein
VHGVALQGIVVEIGNPRRTMAIPEREQCHVGIESAHARAFSVGEQPTRYGELTPEIFTLPAMEKAAGRAERVLVGPPVRTLADHGAVWERRVLHDGAPKHYQYVAIAIAPVLR